ncbi:MAG TPA: hypothetical protein VLL08_05660 [Kineosporiaceae bacterium]|nr:hypothetical protein [Kineosporiaceae bacterium]
MGQTRATPGQPHGAGCYEIRVEGHLAKRWAGWFDGLKLIRQSDGTTLISGLVEDQAALHGLLQKVRDTGLPLVGVTRVEPDRGTGSTATPREPDNHQRSTP